MNSIPVFVYITAAVILMLAILICCYRALNARETLSRLIALDVLANSVIAVIAVWAMWLHRALLLDITLAIALVMFLGTIAYAQFVLSKEVKK